VRSIAIVAVVAAALTLTACQADAPSNGSGTASSSPSASATPIKPAAFVSGGTAEENLAFFGYTVQQAVAGDSKIETVAVARALAASAFAVKGIQYNSERTAAGLASDSSFVAVPYADKCLIAQFGPAIPGIKTSVAAPLQTGGCLVGTGIVTLR
jgi:hypothetical protein